jgi:hypothetical protein
MPATQHRSSFDSISYGSGISLDRSVLFQITLIQIQVATGADRRHACHRLVQCGVTIDARYGTSDPDNSCPATKPEWTYDLDTGGSSSFTGVSEPT